MSKIDEIYKEAQNGSAEAQYELAGYFGEMSHKFTEREKIDYCLDQVLIWLEKSAEQGYAPAGEALAGIRKKYGLDAPAAKPEAAPAAPKPAEPERASAPAEDPDYLRDEPRSVSRVEPRRRTEAPETAAYSRAQDVRGDVPSQPRAWIPDDEEKEFLKAGGADADDTKPYIPYSAARKPVKKRSRESRLVIGVAAVLCVALLIFGVVKVAKLFRSNATKPGSLETSAASSAESSEAQQPEVSGASGETSGETSQSSGETSSETSQSSAEAPQYDLTAATYLEVKPDVFLAANEIVTYRVSSTDGLRLRAGPGTTYTALATVPANTSVKALAKNGVWVFVLYEKQYGWISTDYMTQVN